MIKHTANRWHLEEDIMLKEYVASYYPGKIDWKAIAENIPGRNIRQCMERWRQYLDPNINNEPFTREEDRKLESLVRQCGKKWVSFKKIFKGRTDISIRNRYNFLQRQKQRAKAKQEKKTQNVKSEIKAEENIFEEMENLCESDFIFLG